MLIAIKNKLERYWVKLLSYLYRIEFHKNSGHFYLYPSVKVDNPKYIILESGVTLYRRGWIYVVPSHDTSSLIHIKAGTKIYDNFHITCSEYLEIGQKCLINRNVLITDTIHNYENIHVPIIDQGDRHTPTIIGDDCWIGNNSVIISSKIGKHCIISANTVIVNKDIPEYSVVAGNPGKIIKHYNHELKEWVRI